MQRGQCWIIYVFPSLLCHSFNLTCIHAYLVLADFWTRIWQWLFVGKTDRKSTSGIWHSHLALRSKGEFLFVVFWMPFLHSNPHPIPSQHIQKSPHRSSLFCQGSQMTPRPLPDLQNKFYTHFFTASTFPNTSEPIQPNGLICSQRVSFHSRQVFYINTLPMWIF